MTESPDVRLTDLTPTMQSYLMAVRALGAGGDAVTSGALAERLGASPSTVTEGVRKLVTLGVAEHRPYAPVELTENGHRLAVAMVRRHRILETFLARCLDYTWDEVHAEADMLEHVVSDRFVDALDTFLGHPRRDPHGDPIPRLDGTIPYPEDACRLDQAAPGTYIVVRISDEDPDRLHRLTDLKLRPGAKVLVDELGVGRTPSGTRVEMSDQASIHARPAN